MKSRNNKIKIISILIVLICICQFLAMAQDPGDDPDNVPIDGGLGLLIAAGAAYGVKKYRDARKEKPMPGDENEIEK